jgi:hypothetical protein
VVIAVLFVVGVAAYFVYVKFFLPKSDMARRLKKGQLYNPILNLDDDFPTLDEK